MAKIGTVQVEVNPVANEAKWDAVCQQIEDRVAAAVERGVERGLAKTTEGATHHARYVPGRGMVSGVWSETTGPYSV